MKRKDRIRCAIANMREDLHRFGFGAYAIDFSFLSEKKVRYLGECIQRYNKENPDEPRREYDDEDD